MVLAAGAGKRLLPDTEGFPKTLLPVDGARSILDVALGNLKHLGLETVVVVVGVAAERIADRAPELQRRHGVDLELVFNPKAEEWNNAYSLWCAREAFAEGVLMVNGDTVHPAVVEERLLAARGTELVLAVDSEKPLGEEEMKVRLSPQGLLERIHKQIDPATAHGEYIGLTLIEPEAATPLAEALEATWRRDPGLYYEDGFQEFADRGGRVGTAAVGGVEWVEVDDHADLARARELACRC
ncbi:MAG TPA: phosphocholine cytidylyltransferase family protein [Solirubrobacteraceae bacterium]|nr:phosphocholine cytidylyltransferase family protein [Solirubrobacteraceae bacterium]